MQRRVAIADHASQGCVAAQSMTTRPRSPTFLETDRVWFFLAGPDETVRDWPPPGDRRRAQGWTIDIVPPTSTLEDGDVLDLGDRQLRVCTHAGARARPHLPARRAQRHPRSPRTRRTTGRTSCTTTSATSPRGRPASAGSPTRSRAPSARVVRLPAGGQVIAPPAALRRRRRQRDLASERAAPATAVGEDVLALAMRADVLRAGRRTSRSRPRLGPERGADLARRLQVLRRPAGTGMRAAAAGSAGRTAMSGAAAGRRRNASPEHRPSSGRPRTPR